MINLSPKEQSELYGRAVTDFINAKTTDEACLSLIPKMKLTFDFSIDFEKKAEENFPYLNNALDGLNERQKAILELYFDIWSFDKFVEIFLERFYVPSDNIDFEKLYNDFIKDLWDMKKSGEFNNKKIDNILINIKKIQPLFENRPFDWKNFFDEFCGQLIARKKMNNLFDDYSNNIPEKEEKSMKKVLNSDLFGAHHDIYHSQQIFKIIINRFVNHISLNKYPSLEDIIEKYDRNFSANLIFDNNYKINYEHSSMNEDDFLQSPPDHLKKYSYEKFKNILQKSYGQIIFPAFDENQSELEKLEAIHDRLKGYCLDRYNLASYYFFVEFLKKENNYKLFNVCDICKKYFVAGKFDNRIKFCSTCSSKSKMSKKKRREYQRKYRQKQKQKELVIQKEARIENLMKRTGYSREEVIEIIEADSEM